jgi:hypothetical protein
MAPVTHSPQLVLEGVKLGKEQDDRRPEKPPRVDHQIKKDKGLGHPVLKVTPVVRLR